jgi:hypothetical protein
MDRWMRQGGQGGQGAVVRGSDVKPLQKIRLSSMRQVS